MNFILGIVKKEPRASDSVEICVIISFLHRNSWVKGNLSPKRLYHIKDPFSTILISVLIITAEEIKITSNTHHWIND